MLMIIKKLQVTIMWHRLIANIKSFFDQTIVGLAVIAIGSVLWLDRNYFFWPPELKGLMNNVWLDRAILIMGTGILLCALTGNRAKWLQHLLFIVTEPTMIILAIAQLWHVIYVGEYRMGYTVICNVVICLLIFECAYES